MAWRKEEVGLVPSFLRLACLALAFISDPAPASTSDFVQERPRVILPLSLSEPLSPKWFASMPTPSLPNLCPSLLTLSPPFPQPTLSFRRFACRFRTHFSLLLTHPAYLAAFPSHANLPSSLTSTGVEGEIDPPVIYTAIVGRDSSVVYYRVARGIEKPHDVPE